MHCAVESAGLDVVLLLLRYVEGNASPYRKVLAKDMNGRTSLHVAAMRDRVDILEALFDECKPQFTSVDGQELLDRAKHSPLYYALLNGNMG